MIRHIAITDRATHDVTNLIGAHKRLPEAQDIAKVARSTGFCPGAVALPHGNPSRVVCQGRTLWVAPAIPEIEWEGKRLRIYSLPNFTADRVLWVDSMSSLPGAMYYVGGRRIAWTQPLDEPAMRYVVQQAAKAPEHAHIGKTRYPSAKGAVLRTKRDAGLWIAQGSTLVVDIKGSTICMIY